MPELPRPFGRRPTPSTTLPPSSDDIQALRIDELTRRADAGDVPAMRFAAAAFEAGSNGAAKDSVVALRWFLKADAAGDAPSSYRLAQMYENGDGVLRDHLEAIKR